MKKTAVQYARALASLIKCAVLTDNHQVIDKWVFSSVTDILSMLVVEKFRTTFKCRLCLKLLVSLQHNQGMINTLLRTDWKADSFFVQKLSSSNRFINIKWKYLCHMVNYHCLNQWMM